MEARMNTRLKTSLALGAAVLLSAVAAALSGGGSGFDLSWHSIDGSGGGTSAGAGFQLAGTIGQSGAGAMSGGGYALVGGFWAVDAQPAMPCPGDIDGDGAVDVEDLVQVVIGWGVCPPAPCPADTSGDGVVAVEDLVTVILTWGTCP
jgi:hypothetical protein